MRALILALAAATALAMPAKAQDVTVAVTAIVEHPALDAARDGVKEALAEAGYKEGENLTFLYESAQGNPGTAALIARQFLGEEPTRSEQRRVGNESVRTGRSRWSPDHITKKQ